MNEPIDRRKLRDKVVSFTPTECLEWIKEKAQSTEHTLSAYVNLTMERWQDFRQRAPHLNRGREEYNDMQRTWKDRWVRVVRDSAPEIVTQHPEKTNEAIARDHLKPMIDAELKRASDAGTSLMWKGIKAPGAPEIARELGKMRLRR